MSSGGRTARQKEECLILRRNADLRQQEHCNSVAEYFKTWDVKASKYAAWTSPKYFQERQEARVEAEEKEKRQHSLNTRREKLRQVLSQEEKLYEGELKRLTPYRGMSWMPLDELKSINYELKRKSEESRKREAQLMQYQQWKHQQPTLKDFERRQHLDFMKKSWIDQVKEREAAMEKQKADEYVRLKDEESRRKEEEEIEKLCNRHKEEEIALLKSQIKSQMEAVRKSVHNYKELEKQEAEERRLQNEIEEMIIQRHLSERKQSDKQLVTYWTRQYQLKLQKKAKEMEEEIAQDQKILEKLSEEVRQEAQKRAQTRHIAKKEMEIALKELHMNRQREILRQNEYEHMYFEEAKRAWERQEEKWAKEQRARDALMKEVLDTVGKQVEEKLRRNSEERAKALEERELLLKGINDLYQQCKQQELGVKIARDNYCTELDHQVEEKTIERAMKALEEANQGKLLSKADQENEQKLALELQQMHLNTDRYRQQDFRRRRVQW